MINDLVNHPPHYNSGNIETFDFIKDQLTAEEFRGYIKGNALKYISRERHKGGDDDLRKAQWYLNKYLNNEPATIVGPYGPRSTKRTAPSIMDVLTPFGREKIYEELNNESTTENEENSG